MGLYLSGDTGGGNVTSITDCVWPGGLLAGDLAILAWVYQASATSVVNPTGFAVERSQVDTNTKLVCLSKVCTGSESGAISGWSESINRQSAALVILRGPLSVDAVTSANETSLIAVTDHLCPAGTPNFNNDNVLIISAERISSGSSSTTPPSGYTIAQQIGTVGSGGSFVGIAYKGSGGVLDYDHPKGTGINPGSFSNNVASTDACTMTVLLKPTPYRSPDPHPTRRVLHLIGR